MQNKTLYILDIDSSLVRSVKLLYVHRKSPNISPGLIFFRKGRGLIYGGLYMDDLLC